MGASKFRAVWYVGVGMGWMVGVRAGGRSGKEARHRMGHRWGEAQYLGKGWGLGSGWDKARPLGDRSGLGRRMGDVIGRQVGVREESV